MSFKSSLLLLGMVAATCGIGHAAPTRQLVPQGPVSYSSPVTGFAVWLPGKIRYGGYSIGSVFFPDASKEKTDSLSFLVTFGINLAQNPPTGPKIPTEKFLANLVDSVRDDTDSGSFESHSIVQDDVPGYELRYLTSRGFKGRVLHRLYATPQRLYQIHVLGSEAVMAKNRALVDKVFNSFHILPQ